MRLCPAILLLSAALAACAPDPDAPAAPPAAPPVRTDPPPAATGRPASRAGTGEPAPPPPVVFDTTEPPAVVQQIAPRPVPPPSPPPGPSPSNAPPASRPPGPAGSCDVRETENYCFTYTGPAWTPESADAHCDAAPEAVFRDGPCPTADRIATCTFRRPTDPAREIVYTTYAPADLSLARLACPGVFEVIE